MRIGQHKSRLAPSVTWVLALAILFAPLAAQAYVGPGAGLSLLGALWGLLCAIGAAFLFVIMWPIRRLRRRKREAKQAEKERASIISAKSNTPDSTARDSSRRRSMRWIRSS